ncbi:hypothetical protein IP88_00295 [alpha proteobacterium AAP81b]|nr:hypothetical protein IP88_00295 [alpha proteobacterium AAP81b]
MSVVLDSSALLAVLQGEPGADAVMPALQGALVSAVNAAEVVTKLVEIGMTPVEAGTNLTRLDVDIIAFDAVQAQQTGALRPLTRHLGLSLGDRACLALAQQRRATVLTADRPWAGLDLGIAIEVIR